jgi:bla regulator protein BlaR1
MLDAARTAETTDVDQSPQGEVVVDLSRFFSAYPGTFVLLEPSGRIVRHAKDRASRRLPPCSTFKIFNTLAGLEAGAVADESSAFKWSGEPKPIKSWERDHSLASAVADSVVWYFQEVASRVGLERMQLYIDRVGYGNRDLSGGLTTFWLGDHASLEISADEQVAFLNRLYRDELPFSPRSMEIARRILVLEKTGEVELSGKTGSLLKGGRFLLGWFVGRVKKGDASWVFAVNIEGEGASGFEAKALAKDILHELNVL